MMKHLLKSITNSSTMLNGYSYDRTPFFAGHAWTRSLMSGAICTGLSVAGVYCGFLAMDAQFAAALGEQAQNFKMASGAVIAALLGYSARDLFSSVTEDAKTSMRVVRANNWLCRGVAQSPNGADRVYMQQTMIRMARFVEFDGGITVYSIGQSQEGGTPFLIEGTLHDHEVQAYATYYTHQADIRSALQDSCAEWSQTVADMLGITLFVDGDEQRTGATRVTQPTCVNGSDIDDELLNAVGLPDGDVSGRASRIRHNPAKVLEKIVGQPPQAVKH